MNPDPHKTKLEHAEEFELAAHKAYALQDFVFAKQLADHAHMLRMQDKQEKLNAITRGTPEAAGKPPPKAD